MYKFQRTVSKPINLNGIALHSGKQSNITIRPAYSNFGIMFYRKDLKGNNLIEVDINNIEQSTLCTKISNSNNASVSTIEHLMSAFAFLGIDNAYVYIDSNEMPAMDGSSKMFLEAVEAGGITDMPQLRKYLKILQTVSVEDKESIVTIEPYDGYYLDVNIDFEHKAIGAQRVEMKNYDIYREEIAPARTFGFKKDLEYLRKNNLGLGASSENSLGFDEEGAINPSKINNEPVKHKMLDLIGDMHIVHAGILGKITATRPSHMINTRLVKEILSNSKNYEWISI